MAAWRDNGSLRLLVEDDGPGFTEEAIRLGHGLHVLKSRLQALFGPNAALNVRAANGARVEVQVPG